MWIKNNKKNYKTLNWKDITYIENKNEKKKLLRTKTEKY